MALCGCEIQFFKLLQHFSKFLNGSNDGTTPSAPVQSGHQQRKKNMIHMTLKLACWCEPAGFSFSESDGQLVFMYTENSGKKSAKVIGAKLLFSINL